jgi:hypothetical protein
LQVPFFDKLNLATNLPFILQIITSFTYITFPENYFKLKIELEPLEGKMDNGCIVTVILSFLERERDRTVTVFDYSFQSVTELRLESS